MPTVADVVRRYGAAYLAKFGKSVPLEHRKVLSMIARCRTGELGTVIYRCEHCHRQHAVSRSCGNRHCPTCQQHKTKAWLADQTARLLPTHYFLLTFTIPASLRSFVRSHQRACYAALFTASSDTIRTLAADPKYVGSSDCGFFGVLHTWGRDLNYHPHVHYVVPGGAVSKDGQQWLPSAPNFFVPVKAASIIYREKFRERMRKAGLLSEIDPNVWGEEWIVNSQAVGNGERSLKYLAPYVFRVAISNRRMIAIEDDNDGQVTFGYRKSGSQRWRRMTISAEEFLRRFLQHVLPRGFQKVRHYGFASATRRARYKNVRWLVTLAMRLVYLLHAQSKTPPRRTEFCCTEYGGPVVFFEFIRPATQNKPPLIDTS
jgi:Putative transposase/Transposase zinc-binding domain